jgi:transcriptional regulator with PAS, ATPase and Fis domain
VISLPPLRERGDDIKVLARTFLQGISQELNRVPPRITPEAIMLLHRHPWPGNVRELKSVMKRAALFAGDVLTGEKLTAVMAGFTQTETGVDRLQTLEDYKRLAVKQALAATDGKKMDAARLLDVDYSSFKRMLDRYKL